MRRAYTCDTDSRSHPLPTNPQNFLVNLSWIIGGTIALLSLCAYQRKKEDREDREKKIKEIEEKRNAKT